jgi:tRNA nucleotidyltransferase (CCA-adding enzyme)
MRTVLQQAKKIVIPSKKLVREKERIAKIAYELVKNEVTKYPQIKEVEFGGSYAKGTWLPEKADIDIFIKFEKNTPEKRFTEITKKVGFDSLKRYRPYIRFSEHPYVEAIINKAKVNVVPCYLVPKGEWQSAADRSQYHTAFILQSLSGEMKDEVRLLKRFLRNNGIYGAEIAKQGFSGYVAEVLILNFGSFKGVIEEFAKIKTNQVIGIAAKRFYTPIVIMDPIDNNRNLTTAISVENIGKFILLCRQFLIRPSLTFFTLRKRVTSKSLLKNVLVIRFCYKERSPDIIWGQIKRAANSISVQLELAGYRVIRSSAITDERNEAAMLFLLESIKISDNYVKEGPEFFNDKDVERFTKKNILKTRLMWINKNSHIFSLEKRSYNDARNFINHLLTKDLQKSGIPSGLKEDICKGFKILKGNKTTGKSIKEAAIELVSTDEAAFSINK